VIEKNHLQVKTLSVRVNVNNSISKDLRTDEDLIIPDKISNAKV